MRRIRQVLAERERLVLLVSILASFVAFLDGSIVNVALPAIMHDLGGGLTTQQWVVDAYAITLGALMLIAGSLSDLFGRKRILQWGLCGFGVASLLCAIAPSGLVLILARASQGAAGALLVPSSLALIISIFPRGRQGKAIGTWTAWTGISFVIGPLLGGLLIDAASWRLIFLVNVVPIALTLRLLQKLAIDDRPQHRANVDVVGAVSCAIGLGGSVFALIEQSRYGWSNPLVYVPLVVGVLTFGSFLAYERRAANPMLVFSLFASRNFSVGNVATAAIYAGLSVSSFIITIFVQQVGGYSALRAGAATLPITIMMFFLSSRFGALGAKFGPRWFMTAGPLVAACGFLLLLHVNADVHYWTTLFPGVVVFGLGLSMTVAPLTAAVLGAIDSEHSGIASAVNNAVSRVAGLAAVAAVGVVIGSTLTTVGFHRVLVCTAVLMLVGAIVSAIGIQNKAKPVRVD
jgi:EmrB/QacA subfamily drug resistance transporter